jgi:hypothetical protein
MNREEDRLPMRVTKSTRALDFNLVAAFDREREKLLSGDYADRLDKPLGFWALPTDRQLPLALIHRTLGDVLAVPFSELYATPSVGPKKIRSLVMLLERAGQPQPPGAIPPPPLARAAMMNTAPPQIGAPDASANGDVPSAAPNEAAAIVSEALWEQWRATAREHDLGDEPLGRFAASLQQLPGVLWITRLETYLDLSLADLRGLRTHGVKRVAAVLEVFRGIHTMLAHAGTQEHLSTRVVPRFAAQIERWIARQSSQHATVDEEQVRGFVAAPVLEQVRLDVGELAAEVATIRLRPGEFNVQQTAHRLRTTRSRVYETASETASALWVRWPEGRTWLSKLRHRLATSAAQSETEALIDGLGFLYSPITRGEGVASPPVARSPHSAANRHTAQGPARMRAGVAAGR